MRVVRREFSEERAIDAVALMHRAEIVSVDAALALAAADVASAHGLAMADAIIYATALRHDATLVTGDADFDGLANALVIR
jgi:predicted nucleic acid-binding protein